MKKALLITVGTGRTGSDVAHGIAFAVRQLHPEFTIFVVTPQSRESTLPFVLENTGLKEEDYEVMESEEVDDVDKITMEYLGYVKELIERGFRPEEIAVDFTSGTKAMSAGLVAAAISMELGTISYVYGERGEGGRVISGTERLMTLEPNLILTENKTKLAIRLFNSYQYAGCLEILEEAKGRTSKPEIVEKLSFLETLACAYSAWDRFDLKGAMAEFKKLRGHPLLAEFGLEEQVEGNKRIVYQAIKDEYSSARAVDLFQNAGRRAEEGKFDDAVARLYRLMEYLAQVKLYRDHDGLISGDVDVTKLPVELQPKYECLRGERGKIELPLVKGYELLCDLGDPLGSRFMEDLGSRNSRVKSALGARNSSILAHGFGPVGERGYGQCLALVRNYLDLAFDGWRRLAEDAKFPRIQM